MAVGRGDTYNGDTFGNYGGSYDEPYQMKRVKTTKLRVWNVGVQDPEMKRKKRVASYKVYTVEANVKRSVKSSWRWMKNKYINIRYGWF